MLLSWHHLFMGSQALSAISLQPLFSLLPSRELEDSAGKRR